MSCVTSSSNLFVRSHAQVVLLWNISGHPDGVAAHLLQVPFLVIVSSFSTAMVNIEFMSTVLANCDCSRWLICTSFHGHHLKIGSGRFWSNLTLLI